MSSNINDITKLEQLIDTASELLSTYNNYNTGVLSFSTQSNPVYATAVAAIVSWFSLQGYMLSAECLLHAESNTVLDSIYYPNYGSRVGSSTITTNIKSGSATSGSSAYPNSGTVVQKDLYYAIHAFSWTKSSNNVVTINDRYDFELDLLNAYNGLANTAVNVMALAQGAGYITPYKIKIQY
jgi:hypothetical protein